MTLYLWCIYENLTKFGQKLKVAPVMNFAPKAVEVFKMTKNLNFQRKFAISGSFDEKLSKVG